MKKTVPQDNITRISSFNVNHLTHNAGVYLSREDGGILTLDIRVRAPYREKLLTNAELHSVEHMLATYLRNSAYSKNIVYFGPMGCQTGFYLVTQGLNFTEAKSALKSALTQTANHSEKMFGKSAIECGNYKNLSVNKARILAQEILEKSGL